MKLAIVHDHLAQDGGAEKVLKVFHEVYPEAPTFTLVHDRDRANPAFLSKDIRTSFIQKIPGGVARYQWFLPLMPAATERYDLRDYNVVLSSSSAFSKGIITRPGTLHICYCHTPTRYLWSDTHDYVRELKYGRLVKTFVPFVLTNLRLWDRLTADRVDVFIANSATVQRRIWKYYRRKSVIIHPPVLTKRFSITKPENFFLTGGRLVYYKRFDIAVRAFSKLGIPLKVFGTGPEIDNLKKMAKPNVSFIGAVSDEALASLYSRCQAFIHCQEEDFGITAVEAMAAGRPVIAYAAGGALETIVPGVTGKFIQEQTWEELADAVIRFRFDKFEPEVIKAHAAKFDVDVFKTKMDGFIRETWEKFRASPDSMANH